MSIITPAFGAEETLVDAVQSKLAQTYQHLEMHIISDDGVDYQEYLNANHINDPRIRFFETSEIQSGPNVGRNIGLSHARGEWISPLDADDVYYPQWLELLIEAAGPTGLSLDNAIVVGPGVVPRTAIEGKMTQFSFDTMKICLVPLVFLFHRRHVTHGWDEDIVRGADTIFNLRALESAGTAGFLYKPYHEYRVHPQSMCHAPGAQRLFDDAYQHTLKRLRSDGLGFRCNSFREQVTDMIAEKQKINRDFISAVEKGYIGNYQSFVKEQQLC